MKWNRNTFANKRSARSHARQGKGESINSPAVVGAKERLRNLRVAAGVMDNAIHTRAWSPVRSEALERDIESAVVRLDYLRTKQLEQKS